MVSDRVLRAHLRRAGQETFPQRILNLERKISKLESDEDFLFIFIAIF